MKSISALAAREVEIQELRSHIAELEAQQGDSQRLIPAGFKDPFRDWGRLVGWTLPPD